jgi:replicative DNA helicase
MSGFDQAFQEQLAAHYFRDDHFVSAAGTLVLPDYFTDPNLQALVAVQQGYLAQYGVTCSPKTFVQWLQAEIAAKRAKISDMNEAKRLLGTIYTHDIKDRQFVLDKIVEFSRTQALTNATMDLVDALDNGKPDFVEKALLKIEAAKNVGAADTATAVDYRRSYQDRKALRKARMNGSVSALGITTGNAELDKQLTPHMGWGRKELSILMGPPKSGKTAALISFGLAAAYAGYKVFYASHEVSEDIIGERADANISGVPLKQLGAREADVDAAMAAWDAHPGLGEFIVQAFPMNTCKVSDLHRILKKYQAQGTDFDLIITDYLGIMAPERYYEQTRNGLAEIGKNLRGLATIFNAAVITGYQTNRDGTKKASRTVSDGTDAADDYEVVRTADALMTINRTEDDRDNGQFVLYFSEMRNAETGLKMRFSQDMRCMRFIIDFLGYD